MSYTSVKAADVTFACTKWRQHREGEIALGKKAMVDAKMKEKRWWWRKPYTEAKAIEALENEGFFSEYLWLNELWWRDAESVTKLERLAAVSCSGFIELSKSDAKIICEFMPKNDSPQTT